MLILLATIFLVAPAASSPIARVVRIEKDSQADIKRGNRTMHVSGGMNLFDGDRITVAKGIITTVCLNDFARGEWRNIRDMTVVCRASPNDSHARFLRGISSGREVAATLTRGGKEIYRPKGLKGKEILARIILSRPEDWLCPISLNQATRLGEADKASLIAEIEKKWGSNEDDAKPLKADVLASAELYRQAISLLDSISGASEDPHIQIAVGDLCLALDDAIEALRRFQVAAGMADAQSDVRASAIANESIGIIYISSGGTPDNVKSAKRFLLLAADKFDSAGDPDVAKSIKMSLGSTQE